MPTCDTVERTVITITTNSQTINREENSTAADEATEADEETEIRAQLPTTASRTLTTDISMPTSPICCLYRNQYPHLAGPQTGEDPTPTPTRPSGTITKSPEGGRVHSSEAGLIESTGRNENVEKFSEKKTMLGGVAE